jgi:hypothetical protein
MTLKIIVTLFSILILVGVILAVVIYKRKSILRQFSIQFVKINKAEGYLTLGDSEHVLFCDILNFRSTSQFHTQWNEYGLDNQKYDLVYLKDGLKKVVSLIVYDNEPESVAKRDELKEIVARLRYERIQNIKHKSKIVNN